MNYVTKFELDRLKKLAAQVLPTSYIVEIGVLDGETSIALLGVTSPEVKYIGIDPLIPDSMKPELKGDLHKLLKLESLYSNFTFIKSYSQLVNKDYYVPPSVGLLFIDGSHIYEDVKQDFEVWLDKVAVGGHICFHDAYPITDGFRGWPGPLRLIKEIVEGLHPKSKSVSLQSVDDTLVTFVKLK